MVRGLLDRRGVVRVVEHERDRVLGCDAALSMRTRGELVARSAADVAAHEEALHGRLTVVAARRPFLVPLFRRAEVIGTAAPEARAARVRTEEIGLGRHDLGRDLVRLDVLGGPEAGLADGHIEEVFPCLCLEVLHLLGAFLLAELLVEGLVDGRHCLIGSHEDRAFAELHVAHHQVVADGRAEVIDILAVLRLGFCQGFRIRRNSLRRGCWSPWP